MNEWNERARKKLIEIATSEGLKYSHIARVTGIPAQTLSSWKQGRFNFKEDKLSRLENFFNKFSE